MKDWYCKPDTEEEAKEIIERAVANGAHNKYNWMGNSSELYYGVVNGQVVALDEVYHEDAECLSTQDNLTIEQVREMFPLESDKKRESQWITITNPSDIKNVPAGRKIRINGVENVLTDHYGYGDNGFDTEKEVDGCDTFGDEMWDEGYTVEYLLEAPVEHTESISGGTDATLPVSEESDVEVSEVTISPSLSDVQMTEGDGVRHFSLKGGLGVKQERYQDQTGDDWIDECARTFTPEEFRGAMKFTIGKYTRRVGKKDAIIQEIEKIADYANRWLDYEKKLEEK